MRRDEAEDYEDEDSDDDGDQGSTLWTAHSDAINPLFLLKN